ncbi:MAG: preprotein translocase subunit SecA, partial [bacterium]|nr:preprotein translocase subunit SecA [bacterium]
VKKMFGTGNDRELKKLQPKVDAVNALEPAMQKCSDSQLKEYTSIFKKRLAEGETPDHLLVEAFAVVRETGRRLLNMRHFDVQIMGGIALHQGRIAEMKTGEGKTLAATLPAYLNALEEKGVHIVTVNDYLAVRDAAWMGKIYSFLGLSVGVVHGDMDNQTRHHAYACDITYGTNNEFGFDYLRDNMKFYKEDLCQRGFHYSIVDEVDSILIDEARIPLIISTSAGESVTTYKQADDFVVEIKQDNRYFQKDEKSKTVTLSEEGIAKAEAFFNLDNLYELINIETIHKINQALKAHLLFARDVDYLLKDDKVVIVDEFTGRLAQGRRFSDGLHQALEAREKVEVEKETRTCASITYQNYFKMYSKLAGMTGTAVTEAEEFYSIYKLDVVAIPTNKNLIRIEYPDVVFCTMEEKWRAVAVEIKRLHTEGRPVLAGTLSIETSELLSRILEGQGIPHVVLNAKLHKREASIVAQAGRPGAVTIATNMAGRGTDILLGGNPEMLLQEKIEKSDRDPDDIPEEEIQEMKKQIEDSVKKEREEVIKLGGLHILGTERHEARRIDNQLRGRSGRQGDPGSSRFYLSLDDGFLKVGGGDRIKSMVSRLNAMTNQPIEHKMISYSIEHAQKQMESRNFSIRKHLLQYDDIINKQRQYIYFMRNDVLEAKDKEKNIAPFFEKVFLDFFDRRFMQNMESQNNTGKAPALTAKGAVDYKLVKEEILKHLNIDMDVLCQGKFTQMSLETIKDVLLELVKNVCSEKMKRIGEETLREFGWMYMLQKMDSLWQDHLTNIDYLRDGIDLRGYAQQNPLIAYKNESFQLFLLLLERFELEALHFLFFIEIRQEEPAEDENDVPDE